MISAKKRNAYIRVDGEFHNRIHEVVLASDVAELEAERDRLLEAAAFFFGMATGALVEECGEWDRHETNLDAALSAQGGSHD